MSDFVRMKISIDVIGQKYRIVHSAIKQEILIDLSFDNNYCVFAFDIDGKYKELRCHALQ